MEQAGGRSLAELQDAVHVVRDVASDLLSYATASPRRRALEEALRRLSVVERRLGAEGRKDARSVWVADLLDDVMDWCSSAALGLGVRLWVHRPATPLRVEGTTRVDLRPVTRAVMDALRAAEGGEVVLRVSHDAEGSAAFDVLHRRTTDAELVQERVELPVRCIETRSSASCATALRALYVTAGGDPEWAARACSRPDVHVAASELNDIASCIETASEPGAPLDVVFCEVGGDPEASLRQIRLARGSNLFVVAITDGWSEDIPVGLADDACSRHVLHRHLDEIYAAARRRSRDAVLQPHASQSLRVPSKTTGHALVLSRDAALCRMMFEHLRAVGLECESCHTLARLQERASAEPFDMVFMDLGHLEEAAVEAVRAVHRCAVRADGSPAEVIGLTPRGQSVGVRWRFFAIGISEILETPIVASDIEAVHRLIDPSGGPASGETPESPEASRDVDVDRLRVLYDLERASGEAQLMDELIGDFLDHAIGGVAAIRAATEHKDLSTIALEAHTLRGSSDSIGARRVEEAVRHLEQVAAHADWDVIGSWVALVDSCLTQTGPALRTAASRLREEALDADFTSPVGSR